MFSKLALRNVTRSLKDYAVYFLTLTFGVCIFYVFNSLDSQSAVRLLSTSGSGTVRGIFQLVGVFSGLVTVVLAGLILYANNFLMKRRKREIGTYFLLGLPTGAVAKMLVLETLLIGLAALVSGLLLGVLAAQGLNALTVAMFETFPLDAGFAFSWGAVGKTVLYFGGIFLVVMVFTGVSVSKAKLIDLIRGGRSNEEIRQRPLWVSVATFLAGAALLAGAYFLLLTRGILAIDFIYLIMLAMGTVGTFLVFRSLSGFLLRLTKGHKFYYKGLNMFILRQWSGKVHTNCLSNTVICLLLLLAIGVTACSVGLNDTIGANASVQTPYDVSILNYGGGTEYEKVDFPQKLREAGGDPDALFAETVDVTLWYNDPEVTGFSAEEAYAAISLTDYNSAMDAQGAARLEALAAPELTPRGVVNGPSADGILVVPDALTDSLRPRRQIFSAQYSGDAAASDAQLRALLGQESFAPGMELTANFRLDNYLDLMGSKLLTLYMGLYLGLVFLLTAAAVLALQQLTQAADAAPQYRLLSKLGASEKLCRGAVLSQVCLAFLLPLALALIHAVVGMASANEFIAMTGKVDSVRSSLITAVSLVVIYGGYLLATYAGSLRAARTAQERRE